MFADYFLVRGSEGMLSVCHFVKDLLGYSCTFYLYFKRDVKCWRERQMCHHSHPFWEQMLWHFWKQNIGLRVCVGRRQKTSRKSLTPEAIWSPATPLLTALHKDSQMHALARNDAACPEGKRFGHKAPFIVTNTELYVHRVYIVLLRYTAESDL